MNAPLTVAATAKVLKVPARLQASDTEDVTAAEVADVVSLSVGKACANAEVDIAEMARVAKRIFFMGFYLCN